MSASDLMPQLVSLNKFEDKRGSFLKSFNPAMVDGEGHKERSNIREIFMTVSGQNIIRGMHFQTPPHDHHKYVTCLNGRVLDVLLDIRPNSGTYGAVHSFELCSEKPETLAIPTGFAHGFLSLTDNATLLYAVTTEFNVESDSGVRWDSFGFSWPVVSKPVISERDNLHPKFNDFESPFS